ncbi:DUF1080 domain-containing protein [Verrucomicrobia bacterium S94]|nr:DUF1080 domain-containing protein [Verrucomicrobia bacterium S94]
MKKTILTFTAVAAAFAVNAAEKKNPHADNPFLPDGYRVHDYSRPLPPVVTPGEKSCLPPSDAYVLFDGTDLTEWVGTVSTNKKKYYNPDGKALWKVQDGYMEVNGTGSLISRKQFGDCQIHLEWMTPNDSESLNKKDQGRGNSGVFIMGRYEIQVLDCFENTSYADGMTAALYGQHPALANACRPAGQWQTYDIIFRAPRFEGDKVISPAAATVIHNGVVVQNNTEFLGISTYKKLPKYWPHPEKGPLLLQDHNNPIRYRNIWVREL